MHWSISEGLFRIRDFEGLQGPTCFSLTSLGSGNSLEKLHNAAFLTSHLAFSDVMGSQGPHECVDLEPNILWPFPS